MLQRYYRGIALCSALCKVIDIIVIERYNTSDTVQALHSTSMCNCKRGV